MSKMKVLLVATGLMMSAGVAQAITADQITSAIEATAADEAKVKNYCAMAKKIAEIGDDEKKAEAAGDEIDGYFKSLGADFEAAWNAGQDAADETPEAKAFDAAMTKLDDKCGAG